MICLQQSIKEMSDVEKAFARGDFENVLFRDPTLGKMLTARILGASFGGAAQRKLQDMLGAIGIQGVRGGLVAESAGSEMLQKLLLRSPEIKTTNIMVNLMNDPKALGAMLRKLKDEDDLNTQMKKLETVFSILARSTGRRTIRNKRGARRRASRVARIKSTKRFCRQCRLLKCNLAKLYHRLLPHLPRPAYNRPRSYPPAALRGRLTATVLSPRFQRTEI